MPIIESSEYEYSREEEERQFLRSLQSPVLEMGSMQPGMGKKGKKGKNGGASGMGGGVVQISDEAPPVSSAFGSQFVYKPI